ncbi:unnamed protein product [Cladocopium goreaui]|uniref:Uncharacterized protein n=1 Tax=Cladocopium goreaui TaxID=2562237 RepID=A0A9P1DPB9_9DINO|nr:unnamed protein product [Cladocopium goreaui]
MEQAKTWRVVRAQALVELDSFLRQSDPQDVRWPLDRFQRTAPRRYDGTPTSTCSDLGKYLAYNMSSTTAVSQGELPAANRLGLSPTSTQGELPPVTVLDSRQVSQERSLRQATLTLDEIPEFRSYTMPELFAMEYQRSKNTTMASMPEIEMDPDDREEGETEVDNKWNSFTL